MPNPYHKGFSPSVPPQTAGELLARIDKFVGECRTPAVLEYGEEVMALRKDEYLLEVRSGKLWIEVWHDNRSLSRRITAIEAQGTALLDCVIHRFGGMPGKLSFLDLERPQTAHRKLTGSRRSFGEQFRRMLSRQLPGWELHSLSAGMDLQRSFSPLFPRARLTRGQRQIAAIACPDAMHENAFLTFALLWFVHVHERAARKALATSLFLFLPEETGKLTAHRLRWLAREELDAKLFLFNLHGSAGEVDPNDLGNLDTQVKSRAQLPQFSREVLDFLQRLSLREGVGVCPELCGLVSVRFRGIEFARIGDGRIWVGMESTEEILHGGLERVEQFAEQLRLLSGELTPQPERWLESAVRANLTVVDPALRETPVHSQVLSVSGGNRDSLDLLAVSREGRLTVLELKAAEDILLPMQALDYWTRVAWHARRGELDQLFPGVTLQAGAPRLLLVAPAISFHSANQTVLRYFSPEIDVERIGINSDWQTRLRVVLRLSRGDRPQSHQISYEHARLDQH